MVKNDIYDLIKYNCCPNDLPGGCNDCILKILNKKYNNGNWFDCREDYTNKNNELGIIIKDNAKYILNKMKLKFLEKYL